MIGYPGEIINWLGFYFFSQNRVEIVAWLCILFSCMSSILQKAYFYFSMTFSIRFSHKCRKANFLGMQHKKCMIPLKEQSIWNIFCILLCNHKSTWVPLSKADRYSWFNKFHIFFSVYALKLIYYVSVWKYSLRESRKVNI